MSILLITDLIFQPSLKTQSKPVSKINIELKFLSIVVLYFVVSPTKFAFISDPSVRSLLKSAFKYGTNKEVGKFISLSIAEPKEIEDVCKYLPSNFNFELLSPVSEYPSKSTIPKSNLE